MKQYEKDQQGLRGWTNCVIQEQGNAVSLAVAFAGLPKDKSLLKELRLAAKHFQSSQPALWKVLKKFYRESNQYLDVLCDRFVADEEKNLKKANEQYRLGEFDDEEEPKSNADIRPFKMRAKEFVAQIAKEMRRSENEVITRLRLAICKHEKIGEVSTDPPGASEGMKEYGRFRTTKYGVFTPGGIFGWVRIIKNRLDHFAHSADVNNRAPRVHLIQTTYQGERQIEREIEISRDKIFLKNPSAAVKALTEYNVYVVRNDFAYTETVNYLNHRPRGREIVRVKTTGWFKIDIGYCFVQAHVPPQLVTIMPKVGRALVRKTSAAKPQPEIIVRLDKPIKDVGRKYGLSVSGTVDEWRSQVAAPLEGCSNVALAVGVAFAGPLLLFAREQTGGFNIYGPSTIGKSAADAGGESVYGIPSTSTALSGDVERFDARWATASDVGIVALAQKRTDTALFLDELGSAKSLREKVIDLIYILTGGTAKLRADSQGNLREQQGFRSLVFSTGEIPLRILVEKLDDTEGRKKRLVDVPALVGEKTALETVPHDKLGEICSGIYANTARLHGAVGQAWLRYLVDLGEAEIRAKLDEHRKAWLALPKIVELIRRDPKDDSVIHRFALLAAALRMSIDAELWPWSVESTDRAIVACCLRWAADKDSSVTTLEQKAAEQKLREGILVARAAHQLIVLNKQPGKGGGLFVPAPEHATMFEDLDEFKKAGTLSGFIKVDNTGTRILLYPDAFRKVSAGCGLEHDALVDYLTRSELLKIENEKVKGQTERFYVLADRIIA
jgi:hypothetical protein